LSIATALLAVAALFQIMDGVQAVALGALRGLGDTAVPMVIAGAGYWLIGFPLGTLAAFPCGLGVLGLRTGIACALASVSLMTSLRFLRRSRLAPEPIERIA
jgi:MATE family multidrug resistance protein